MQEIEPFDEFLKPEIEEFRKQLVATWPKLKIVSLTGQTAWKAAIEKHPHLRNIF